MNPTHVLAQLLLLLLLSATVPAAQANSVGFGSSSYSPQNGQLTVTLVYDFTDFTMLGGGFDLLYDAGALEFVGFEVAPLPGSIWWSGSGAVEVPGVVTNLYLATKFFNGINETGVYGSVVFDVLSTPIADPGCGGFELCLIRNPVDPLVSVFGVDVTDELLADAQARVVPVPAALWLFGSGIALLIATPQRRRSLI